MKSILFSILFCTISWFGFGQEFSLNSFLTENSELDRKTDSIFQSLDQKAIIAQLLMPAVGRLGRTKDTIDAYIKDGCIGGVLMLNGSKDQFTEWIKDFNNIVKNSGQLPFLFSADAEPSLVNRKITGTKTVPRANTIKSKEETEKVAVSISQDLNDIGINYNFSPVVDMSANKTVGYRGFGTKPENIVPFSNAFITRSQEHNIIATAKHFPGHGLVSGDTHKSLQVIDGEMKELQNYTPLIENGVLSIMVAHIAVKNNEEFGTKGLPATASYKIVTELLRDSLGFKGLIVTDAMNMGGISKLPSASAKAIGAGCDIVLMPKNVRVAHKEISNWYTNNRGFREKVNQAAKRIIRMKICLGLIP